MSLTIARAARAAFLAATLLARVSVAQQGAPFEFSIKNIMRGPEVYGREPANVRWTPDGQWIYFQWLPPGTDFRETLKPYRIRAQAGAKPERLSDAQVDSVGPLIANGCGRVPLMRGSLGGRRMVRHAGAINESVRDSGALGLRGVS